MLITLLIHILQNNLGKHIFSITSPKGFSASKCDVGNWILSKFWNFLEKLFGNFMDFFGSLLRIFWEYLGGIFWEDFLGGIFLGGIFWED